MSGNKQYYVTGNTAKGYVNFLHENTKDLAAVYVLHHPSHTVKTAVLKGICDHFNEKDSLEIIHSSFGAKFIDGIIIREQSLAIITDTIATADVPNMKPIHLEKVAQQADDNAAYMAIQLQAKQMREQAYYHFSQAIVVHDALEKIYIKEMNFNKADVIANDFIESLLADVPEQKPSAACYHRLFGATTAEGAINVVPKIIEDLDMRVYIKGRAGTGKSVFMRRVGEACEKRGLGVEWYQCSFDPKSIDMVLVPSLSVCIFDSTKPHAFKPEREGDIVIDLYEKTVTKGTDEKFKVEIAEVTARYQSLLQQGIRNIKTAEGYQDKIEEQYEVKEADVQRMKHIILQAIIE